MAGKATSILLSEAERTELERHIRCATIEYRILLRSKIILLAAKGLETQEIAKQLGISQKAASKWRRRFARYGLDGLSDAKRPGRPPVYTAEDKLKVITASCQKPETVTHWSVRDLTNEINRGSKKKMSHMTVQRIIKESDLKPHQYEMWCNSQDPEFEAKQIDIIGLYLDPPENAIVLCVDEKTGMQALGRTYRRAMRPGYPERVSHEYVRYGTKSLIAAFVVHKGTALGKCYDKHRHQEFIDFLDEIDKRYPTEQLHIIVDNFSTHKHSDVKKWLKKRDGRIKFHFTPTHASWLNQIELWFNILSRKVLKRGVFNSKEELVKTIINYINEYNKEAKPFKWTYRGDPLKV